jgi:putative tryptophan/tyrosine transport system substrate-binding protein
VNRRTFISVLAAAAAWPLAARAQQRERMRRIGALMAHAADDPAVPNRLAAFAQGLQELGWRVGDNVRVDYRWAVSEAERTRYAAELIALAPDVILTTAGSAVGAL